MNIQVAVVDNDPDLLAKISGIINALPGVELNGAFEEAVAVVDHVREQKTDLVFTDIVMPDISGISLAAELKKLEHAPKVVLMSSIPGFSLEAWKIDAFGFIEKPYTRQQIAVMVERFKADREQKEEQHGRK